VTFSQIFIFFSARLVARSCASVLIATNSTHFSHSVTILFSALFPAPHTQITLIFAPGTNSGLMSTIAMKIV